MLSHLRVVAARSARRAFATETSFARAGAAGNHGAAPSGAAGAAKPGTSTAPPHFAGFSKAPGHPSQWTPGEQWIGLGAIATGVTGGLWWWAKRGGGPPEGENGASWERGPA